MRQDNSAKQDVSRILETCPYRSSPYRTFCRGGICVGTGLPRVLGRETTFLIYSEVDLSGFIYSVLR